MAVDVRTLVPRAGRAIQGVAPEQPLSDDQLKDLVADAIANLLLYAGPFFGIQLEVTSVDGAGAPVEYATNVDLTQPQIALVASQAALDHFWHSIRELKMSERIADEGSSWEYSLSPQLFVERLRMLQRARDDAIAMLERQGAALDVYVSFLAVRDPLSALVAEPQTYRGGIGGQQTDYRFGVPLLP